MTERDHFGPTPWWEFDPSEKPVPLGAEWEAADDAELIVNAEHEAIIREDTEPTIATMAAVSGPRRTSFHRFVSPSRPVALAAAVLLVAGCAAMFGLGWRQGAAALSSAPIRSEAAENSHVTRNTTPQKERSSLMDSSINKKRLGKEGGGR